jgi:hypothetical protein
MPAHGFQPGDLCSLTAYVENPGPDALPETALFVVLDIGTGDYWFAPSWAHYPPEIDHYTMAVPVGRWPVVVIPEFHWPSGVGAMQGLRFLGAMTTLQTHELVGTIGVWEWEYGPGA